MFTGGLRATAIVNGGRLSLVISQKTECLYQKAHGFLWAFPFKVIVFYVVLLKSRLVTKVGFVVIGIGGFLCYLESRTGRAHHKPLLSLDQTPSPSCELTFSSVGHSHYHSGERAKWMRDTKTVVLERHYFFQLCFLRDFMC